jgi:hypothetical protein
MRIRTIKPEFWTHPVMTRQSDATKLLAVGLLNYADDEGYFYAEPRMVRAALRPFDEDSTIVRRGLDDLSNIGFVSVCEHSSHGLIGLVLNFKKHQRVDRPAPSKIRSFYEQTQTQAIEQAMIAPIGEHSSNTPRSLVANVALEQGTGNREQGIKGKDNSSRPKSSTSDGGDVSNSKHPNPAAERFVDWFLGLLSETGAPVPKLTGPNRLRWADTYDKLVRLDGHSKDTIKAVCRWARSDKFWKKNFLSPAKLRDRDGGVMLFDSFLNKMGGYTPPKAAPAAIAEPAGWQAYIDREFPACPWAAGGDSHGTGWAKIPRENQQVIVDDMAKNGESAQ